MVALQIKYVCLLWACLLFCSLGVMATPLCAETYTQEVRVGFEYLLRSGEEDGFPGDRRPCVEINWFKEDWSERKKSSWAHKVVFGLIEKTRSEYCQGWRPKRSGSLYTTSEVLEEGEYYLRITLYDTTYYRRREKKIETWQGKLVVQWDDKMTVVKIENILRSLSVKTVRVKKKGPLVR